MTKSETENSCTVVIHSGFLALDEDERKRVIEMKEREIRGRRGDRDGLG